MEVGTIILATGYSLLDSSKIPQYGYGKYDNAITGLEFEKITRASWPQPLEQLQLSIPGGREKGRR